MREREKDGGQPSNGTSFRIEVAGGKRRGKDVVYGRIVSLPLST